MKTKRFSKKLNLNKNTVANLNITELGAVLGGRTTATCPYVCQTNEMACTAAGCITEVEPHCDDVNPLTAFPCTLTQCTFYCP